MLKRFDLIRRQEALTHAEFVEYWKNVHAPLACRYIPGLRRYVLNIAVLDTPGLQDATIDGVVEMWFDDQAAMTAAFNSPEWDSEERVKSSLHLISRNKDFERSELVTIPFEEYVIPIDRYLP